MRNLVRSFAPWFVFFIAARLASLELAIAAGAIAAVVVCGRANRRISAVWGLAFLVGTLSLWAATSIESRPVLLHVIVPFGAS